MSPREIDGLTGVERRCNCLQSADYEALKNSVFAMKMHSNWNRKWTDMDELKYEFE